MQRGRRRAAADVGFGVDDDGEGDAEAVGRELEAWEKVYANDKSWEDLEEDESGRLKAPDIAAEQRAARQRQRDAFGLGAERVQRGIIRYTVVAIDLSRAASEVDFRPSRMAVVAKHVEEFVRDFYDQNPLSHLGVVVLRDGLARCLADLSASPDSIVKALKMNLTSSGAASIQNALEAAMDLLEGVPPYSHREFLLVFSALSTCDPGHIHASMERARKLHVRCSVVGLAAEVFVCRQLCEKTGGVYTVAMNEGHLRGLILDHAPPPPVPPERSAASLVRMGFPQRASESAAAMCACHMELKLGGLYTCPRCRARVCDLPAECPVCGLTLVSSPHLARSYHHLFPVPPFEEVDVNIAKASSALKASDGSKVTSSMPAACFSCLSKLPMPGESNSQGVRLQCPKCRCHFCFDCDAFIHESLHNCAGCESRPPS